MPHIALEHQLAAIDGAVARLVVVIVGAAQEGHGPGYGGRGIEVAIQPAHKQKRPGARFAVKGVERLHHHALAYGLDHSGNAVGRAPVKDGHMVDGQLLHTLGDLSDSIALRRDHKEQVAIVETV